MDIGDIICREMNQIRYDVIQIMRENVIALEKYVDSVAEQQVENITNQLNEYANECIADASEEITLSIKEKVASSMDNFSNTYLKDIEKPDLGSTGTTKVSSAAKVASLIKFGYKDYLMLMLFINVCADDQIVLKRTADLIQLNMQNAKGGKGQEGQLLFVHNRESGFTMAEAKTYVTVQGCVKVDMLFLNMDFFNRLLAEEGTDIKEQVNAVATIPYNGIGGY